jgi:hypothetical protein
VKVTLSIDPSLIPEGMTATDVQTYYFDELDEWIVLPLRRRRRPGGEAWTWRGQHHDRAVVQPEGTDRGQQAHLRRRDSPANQAAAAPTTTLVSSTSTTSTTTTTTTKIRPERYYYRSDRLGSTSWVTDQNGRVDEHIDYFPDGVWRGQNGRLPPEAHDGDREHEGSEPDRGLGADRKLEWSEWPP